MVRKYSRSRKIAYGEPNMNGSTNAQNVLRSPAWAIIRYSGTTVTVAGTISVATYTQNSTSRPGNCKPRERIRGQHRKRQLAQQDHRGHQRRHRRARGRSPASGQTRCSWPASAGRGNRSGVPVANWRAEVNEVSRPSTNGANVITAPSANAA